MEDIGPSDALVGYRSVDLVQVIGSPTFSSELSNNGLEFNWSLNFDQRSTMKKNSRISNNFGYTPFIKKTNVERTTLLVLPTF